MKAFISYTSDREKMCKLCDSSIDKNERCYVLKNIHVSPKIVDLFFHVECLKKAIPRNL